MSINDITKQLARQYGGKLDVADEMGLKKKAEPRAPRFYDNGDSEDGEAPPWRASPPASGHRFLASERLMLGGDAKAVPKRAPVLMNRYTEEDLEAMFSTPVLRDWYFEDWLEVIGLPPDLHEKLDGAMYQYAARAYLRLKRDSHLT